MKNQVLHFLLSGLMVGALWIVPASRAAVPAPLKRIIIVDDWVKIPTNAAAATALGIEVQGPEFLRRHQDVVQRRLTNCLNSISLAGATSGLTNVLSLIEQLCREFQHPLVDVFITTDSIDDALTQVYVVVMEGKIGQVNVQVSHWPFLGGPPYQAVVSPGTTNALRNRFLGLSRGAPLVPGQLSVLPQKINDGLGRLNRDPEYQQAGLTLVRSKIVGGTDINLHVTNRFFIEPFAGFDTEGNSVMGENRVFAGVQAHDPWGYGHQLTYQAISDVDFRSFLGHVGSYSLPLWGKSSLRFYGGYTDMHLDLANANSALQGLKQDARNYQIGARYSVPVFDVRQASGGTRYRDELYAGFEYKNIGSTLQFSTAPLGTTDVAVAQFILGYRALLVDPLGTNMFSLQGVFSPGGMVAENFDNSFNAIRAGAKSEYCYATLSYARETPLPSLTPQVPVYWDLYGDFQIAGEPLVPSEQMSFGGASRVRGFEPGVLLGDSGIVVRNELGFEVRSLNHLLSLGGSAGSARFHGFFDYGVNYLREKLGGVRDNFGIGSVGCGMRLTAGRHLSAVVDYGWQVIGTDVELVGGSLAKDVTGRLHAYAQIQF